MTASEGISNCVFDKLDRMFGGEGLGFCDCKDWEVLLCVRGEGGEGASSNRVGPCLTTPAEWATVCGGCWVQFPAVPPLRAPGPDNPPTGCLSSWVCHWSCCQWCCPGWSPSPGCAVPLWRQESPQSPAALSGKTPLEGQAWKVWDLSHICAWGKGGSLTTHYCYLSMKNN